MREELAVMREEFEVMREEFAVKKLRAERMVAEKAVWDAITNLRKRVAALEQKPDPNPSDIQEDRRMGEDPINESLVPGPEDVGRWVMVRDGHEPEEGPYILRDVEASSRAEYPFHARYSAWKRARIVPGVGRVTLQEHNGSNTKPEWLSDEDEVLVEYEHGVKAIRFAGFPGWNRVRRYQKMEIK